MVFFGKICRQAPQVPVPCGRIAGRELLPLVEKGWVKDHLGMLNIHQFITQAGMLGGVRERVLSIILEKL